MSLPETTCWTLIEAAAAGDSGARGAFTGLYLDVVRGYLESRWRSLPARQRVDDAVQDVFFECFRQGGPLDRVDRCGAAGFRSFLHAIVRHVALRHEEKSRLQARRLGGEAADVEALPAAEASTSEVFDRAWARAVLRRARDRQRQAAGDDAEAQLLVRILDARFAEDLPIRVIAERIDRPADQVHGLYRRAREDFKRALREEVAFHGNADPAEIERECLRILGMLRVDS